MLVLLQRACLTLGAIGAMLLTTAPSAAAPDQLWTIILHQPLGKIHFAADRLVASEHTLELADGSRIVWPTGIMQVNGGATVVAEPTMTVLRCHASAIPHLAATSLQVSRPRVQLSKHVQIDAESFLIRSDSATVNPQARTIEL